MSACYRSDAGDSAEDGEQEESGGEQTGSAKESSEESESDESDGSDESDEKEDDEENTTPARPMIQYNEGLEVARRVGALRYLGTVHNRLRVWVEANEWYRVLGNAKPRRQ